ncbi:2,3-bisphosphoglycerate-independent phosphoglycerate mutase-like protein, putative [Trypanosoma brucei gambiense DAL972]|uniref:2,3-bisphosphoglycerate-independent phosphoglycerate mutase-like protein, putative n=1 Tax=Trypanosoma brucei gambiense (strain MHOM/CI/86/DAL972) TaxID=679716 RepID=D0A920_TRYB9|nr:2,3-bisphosphoglycerate-independent phosphoglycerate mutase-like protein, putative [Trypanosoma brucei gambiense DAL972]CBH18171.1 2,3-bisphosphoglycerate-independent phosphoglycerate mutase-like protein, putative [Trypanosoma brucei gambiense DAL972]|eukprot:XP_011780435.1 2,3-bisphosphoglycerate-independent phosphoglycerate mutase-like protein, putative [Trypanosoma brucei gambiense DAL972]
MRNAIADATSSHLEGPTTLVFVYGTLQRGENNYPWWLANPRHAAFITVAITRRRYPLFVNLLPGSSSCSPCLLNLPEEGEEDFPEGSFAGVDSDGRVTAHHVVGELFAVTETMKRWLDVLEDVETGLYSVGTIDVVPLDNAQFVERVLLVGEGEAIRALVYFRERDYSEDWRSPSPKCGSTLLRRFSASECVRIYGHRFTGSPAHLRGAVGLREGLERIGHRSPTATPVNPKPIVLFIIDGIGDVSYPGLGHRTPLEVVSGCPSRGEGSGGTGQGDDETFDKFVAPGINVVTRHGVSGVMDVFEAGVTCGSDTAHLSIFGYPPQQYYRGRGAYEALGAGLHLDEGDIAFKCNFSVLDENTGIVLKRRCDRDFTREGPILCEFLDGVVVEVEPEHEIGEVKTHTLKVRYATEHRCGVAITGNGLSHKITGTDPLADDRPLLHCKPTVPPGHEEYEAALYTSRVVNAASERVNELLRCHPINETRRVEGKQVANIVLFRGASNKGWVPPFTVRHGLNGFIVSPTCIIKGLGICCGLSSVDAEGATGDWHTNVNAKVDAVLKELGVANLVEKGSGDNTEEITASPYNFAVLHVKGVDDAGHECSLTHKLVMLKKCGDAMQRLWDALPTGSTMVVLADHSTPISLGDHSCEPVPVSLATKGSEITDGVQFYSEVECVAGALGRFRGEVLMDVVKRAHHWYHYRQ